MKYKKDTTIKRILFCFYILNDIKNNGVNNSKVYIHLKNWMLRNKKTEEKPNGKRRNRKPGTGANQSRGTRINCRER
jgi:hypothetical protein